MTLIQAPIGDIDRMRRPLRPGHVLVTLDDLLLLTWRVPEAEIRRHLPDTLRPVMYEGSGLVSAAVFRNRALRPAVTTFPRMRSLQMNVRAYVRGLGGGEPGSVFFLGLYLSRRWIATISSWMFGVPFRHLPFDIVVTRRGHVEWEARSADHRLAIRAREDSIDVDANTLDLLTNPHTAYFLDRRGMLRRWSIWHRSQAVRTMSVERAEIACLSGIDLGAMMPALYVRSVDYEVYLPPRVASG
jgi:uncharacterized protein YqjF (DUF2071 family)